MDNGDGQVSVMDNLSTGSLVQAFQQQGTARVGIYEQDVEFFLCFS